MRPRMSVGQLVGGVVGEAVRLRRQVVAAQVGRDDAEARLHERCDLLPPAVPELREAVQQDDQRPVAGLDVVQLHVADLGVALAKGGAGVDRRAGEGIGCRGGHDNLLQEIWLCVQLDPAPLASPSRPWNALVCDPGRALVSDHEGSGNAGVLTARTGCELALRLGHRLPACRHPVDHLERGVVHAALVEVLHPRRQVLALRRSRLRRSTP